MLRVPKGRDDEQRERAIHRLKLLGVIDDYYVDWRGAQFEVKLRRATTEDVDAALIAFVRRSQPGRVAAFEAQIATDGAITLREKVMRDARRLVEYVYETIVAARKRAVDEIVRLAEECQDDHQIRDRILRYIELGRVAEQLEQVVDSEPFTFAPWLELFAALETTDDAREWRGATARLLESEPDHPGLLLGRGLAEALVPSGSERVFADSIADGLVSAVQKYSVAKHEVADLLVWLIEWSRGRRRQWAALLYLAGERLLGADHLRYLQPAERSCLSSSGSDDPAELNVVLARRLARHRQALEAVVRRHMETIA